MAKKRKRKIWLYVLVAILLLLLVFIVYFKIVTRIAPPTELHPDELGFERVKVDEDYYRCEGSWLRKNDFGLWELYIEGKPLELGVMNGLLTSELVKSQEDAFVEQIKVMIPSESYLKFLKYFTAWFNKDLDSYIKQEYLLEIYGVSGFASENYEFIGDKYDRILNYHAAHDIGHA
ncbi:MAG: peptidase C45, partial [Bacteroidetes bacterium]